MGWGGGWHGLGTVVRACPPRVESQGVEWTPGGVSSEPPKKGCNLQLRSTNVTNVTNVTKVLSTFVL